MVTYLHNLGDLVLDCPAFLLYDLCAFRLLFWHSHNPALILLHHLAFRGVYRVELNSGAQLALLVWDCSALFLRHCLLLCYVDNLWDILALTKIQLSYIVYCLYFCPE